MGLFSSAFCVVCITESRETQSIQLNSQNLFIIIIIYLSEYYGCKEELDCQTLN